MATFLLHNKGEQFLDANGNPLGGGKLYYYEAGTSNLQDTFLAAADGAPNVNTNPVILGSDGRLQTPVYLGDSDDYEDYKELLRTSGDVTVTPWPFDDIPAAAPTTVSTTFAAPLYTWTQTSGPTVNLTAADVGKAYEADSTVGNITFNLPSAASAGSGKGFTFKKIVGANSLILDPAGSELLDGSSSQYLMGNFMQTKVIASNGAAWFTVAEYLDILGLTRISGLTAAAAVADADELMLQLAGGGALRKVTRSTLIPRRFITSGTLSAAVTLDLTIPTNCDVMHIDLYNWRPATDSVSLFVRFSQAAVFLAGVADYKWGGTIASAAASDSSDSEIELATSVGGNAGEIGHFHIQIYRPSAAATAKTMTWSGAYNNNIPNYVATDGAGELLANTNTIDGVRVFYSSGGIAEGFYVVSATKFA
jgi:hypothetical protein